MQTSTTGISTRQSGFTLVELCVVMALLALFTLIAIPLFNSGGSGALGQSARRLSGTIKYLFNEAALTGREHRLIYNLDKHTYRAKVLKANNEIIDFPGIGRKVSLPDNIRFRDLQLPGRGLFTSGEVTVQIHPSGWIEETGVHLEDQDGNTLTLHVMPLTGASEITDGYKALQRD